MNLIDPIHQHAKIRPDGVAILTPQVTLSWFKLDGLIWSTALKLFNSGLNAGDRVGISAVNPLAHLVISLAVARIGVAQIAIPASENSLARHSVVKKLGLKLIVCDTARIASDTPNHILINKLSISDIDQYQKDQLSSTDGEMAWLILQSSGTTGSPKFSELSHNDAMQRLNHFKDVLNVVPTDVVWVPSRQDFYMSKIALIRALRVGAKSCLPIGISSQRDLVEFLNLHEVTVASGIPSLAMQLAELGLSIPTLRFFGVTSAPVSEVLKKEFKKKVNPNLVVIYATNETGSITMSSLNDISSGIGFVGKPSAGIKIEIVDANSIVQPAGQPGEIRVRVPGAIKAYLDLPEANAASFKDGWFYPGDLGLINSENDLVFLGRKDDMMIFDGINIYPVEIEAVLNAHPDVIEAAAFPLKHARFHQIPVAAVRLRKPLTGEDLLDYCKEKLGVKYPRKIYVLDDFPRNFMGKILKRELALTLRS